MQGIFCNIQFSAIFCLPYTCLTIPRLGKRSRPMALKFLLPFLINNLMARKVNAFFLKIYPGNTKICFYVFVCEFGYIVIIPVSSFIFRTCETFKELFRYVMFPLSVTHDFYGLDL